MGVMAKGDIIGLLLAGATDKFQYCTQTENITHLE